MQSSAAVADAKITSNRAAISNLEDVNTRLKRELQDAQSQLKRQQAEYEKAVQVQKAKAKSKAQESTKHNQDWANRMSTWKSKIEEEKQLVKRARAYLTEQKKALKQEQLRTKQASDLWKVDRDRLRNQQQSGNGKGNGVLSGLATTVAEGREELNNQRRRLNKAIRTLHRAEAALVRREQRVRGATESLEAILHTPQKKNANHQKGRVKVGPGAPPLPTIDLESDGGSGAVRHQSQKLSETVSGLEGSRIGFVKDLSLVYESEEVGGESGERALQHKHKQQQQQQQRGGVDDNFPNLNKNPQTGAYPHPGEETITPVKGVMGTPPHPIITTSTGATNKPKDQVGPTTGKGKVPVLDVAYFKRRVLEYKDKTSVAAVLHTQHCEWLSDVQRFLVTK